MPCDFFTDAILPYLKPAQIDELKIHNAGLNRLINRRRIDLPRTPVDELIISGSKQITYRISNEYVDIDIVDENYMIHIKHLKPAFLLLIGDVKYEKLDVRWLKAVDLVAFDGIPENMTAEEFYQNLQNFNASSVRIFNEMLKLDADKILDSMPSLCELEMKSVSIPSKFYENAVRKSKIGEGIQDICLENDETEPFEAKQLIHIIENAKFRNRSINSNSPNERNIVLDYITGTRVQFAEELMELTRKLNWTMSFDEYFEDFFIIYTPFLLLNVKITMFAERL